MSLPLLNKPFNGESVHEVFEKIKNEPYQPLDENVDIHIKMLIMSILDKDPGRRPSVRKLSKLPNINERISKFLKDNNWEESATAFFEKIGDEEDSEESDDEADSIFDLEKLDVLAQIIRADIELQEVSSGWFKTPEKCATGADIFQWVKQHVTKDNKKVLEICQNMVEQEIIISLKGNKFFEYEENGWYRFYEDREDIASNLLRSWKDPVGNALDVSSELLLLIKEVFNESVVESEDYSEIDADKALVSSKYWSYLNKVSQLQLVNMSFKNINEGLCFFLNVYQWMYVHCLLKNMSAVRNFRKNKSILTTVLSYFKNEATVFFYNIGGYNFTLEGLKHGLLRGNK